jgi:hypothetical protein
MSNSILCYLSHELYHIKLGGTTIPTTNDYTCHIGCTILIIYIIRLRLIEYGYLLYYEIHNLILFLLF